jgi:tetrahydromethanopterin S-methyltransferase subunit G
VQIGTGTASQFNFDRNTGSTKFTWDGTNLDATVGGAKALRLTSTGGSLHGSWESEATLTTSDRRLKTAIAPLARALGGEALSIVRQLRPITYRFRSGPDAKVPRMGFIAQDVEQLLPSLVRTSDIGRKAILLEDLLALAVSAVQEVEAATVVLQQRVDKLEKRVEHEVTSLRNNIGELRKEHDRDIGELRYILNEIGHGVRKDIPPDEREEPTKSLGPRYLPQLDEEVI